MDSCCTSDKPHSPSKWSFLILFTVPINIRALNKIMSLPPSKKSSRPSLQDKLIEKIKILKKIQSEEPTTITYTEAQFILNGKKIKSNIIKMFLKEIHKDTFEYLQTKWYKELT
jgi:hypothetical protein